MPAVTVYGPTRLNQRVAMPSQDLWPFHAQHLHDGMSASVWYGYNSGDYTYLFCETFHGLASAVAMYFFHAFTRISLSLDSRSG